MSTKKNELDVDFIGEQTSLTVAEEKALNKYFKEKKANLKVAERKNAERKAKTATK